MSAARDSGGVRGSSTFRLKWSGRSRPHPRSTPGSRRCTVPPARRCSHESQIRQYRENPATSRYLSVSFANGATIRASPRHRIDHIPAARLAVGGACGPHTVTGIEPLHGACRSFDLLTADAGYRIGRIPVNSMIEEMLAR
jgi:hypothetical protein